MPNLFGVDIASLVGQYIGPGLVDCTLHTIAWGARDVGDPGLGLARTETNVTCKGVLVDYDDRDMENTLVEDGDRMVLLVTTTLSGYVPVTGFQITIEGNRYNVIRVRRDPAAATYTCQVRTT